MRRDAWCSPTMRRAFTLAALLFGTCRHEASAGTLQRYEYVFPDQSIYVYDEDDGFRLVDKVDLPGVIPGLESSDLWPHRSKPTRGDQGRGTAPVKTSQGWYEALVEVDHVPAQTDQLGDAQAVSVGDEDHRAVAVGVAAEPLPARLAQALHL